MSRVSNGIGAWSSGPQRSGDFMRTLLIGLGVLLLACGLQAATIVVPTQASSIQAAINMASAGDTVAVLPGEYQENLNFNGKRLVLTSSGGPAVTRLKPASLGTETIRFTSAEPEGTVVAGFTISGGTSDGQILIGAGAHPTIQDNVICDYAGGGNGVAIKTLTDSCLIQYNLFYDNGGISCIGIWSGSATIVNNTFYNNARGFFTISDRGIAFNNIVMNSRDYGIWGYFTRLEYNDVLGNHPDYAGGAYAGTGSLAVDPLFVSESTHDFILLPSSPCRDAGDPDARYNDADGSRSDIGAGRAVGTVPLGPMALDLRVTPIVGGVVNSLTPTISWSYWDNVGGTQQGYEIEVGTDADSTVAETWQSGQVMSADSQVVYAGTPLEEHNSYWIRVHLYNGTAWGRWTSLQTWVATTGITIHVPADYPTVTAAVDAAFTRDTVLVAPGRYSGNVQFAGKLLRLLSEKGADSTTLVGTGGSSPVVSIGGGVAGEVEVNGFTITKAAQAGISCTEVTPKITNNIIIDDGTSYGGVGLYMRRCSGVIVRGNTFSGNRDAIQLSGSTSGASDTICFNRIASSHSSGLWVDGVTIGCSVYNNTIIRTGSSGISLGNNSALDIRNNIVAYGSSYAIDNSSWSGATIRYNCLYMSGGSIGVTLDTTNVLADPWLADTSVADLRLRIGSPCIDAGDPDARYNDPDGTRNDIGALPLGDPGTVYIRKLTFLNENMMHVVSHTPTFSWDPRIPEGALEDSVEAQVGTTLNWTYTKFWRTGPMPYSDTSLVYAGKALPDGATLYARMRIHSDGIWSEWYMMVFRMNTKPTLPTLIEPDRWELPQGRPRFYMGVSSDAENDPVTYDYRLWTDSLKQTAVDSLLLTTPGYWEISWSSGIETVENQIYWWSARSFDGFEYSDWPSQKMFWVNSVQEAPGPTQPLAPPGPMGEPILTLFPQFDWGASIDPDPFDTVTYKFELSLGSSFELCFTADNREDTTMYLPDSLDFNGHYWWRVSVRDNHGLGSTSLSADFWTWMLGDINHSHLVDLGDLSAMIYYLTVSSDRLSDPAYGDLNADCRIDLKDLTILIAYLTGTPVQFQAGCGSPHPVKFTPKPVERPMGKTEAGSTQ